VIAFITKFFIQIATALSWQFLHSSTWRQYFGSKYNMQIKAVTQHSEDIHQGNAQF